MRGHRHASGDMDEIHNNPDQQEILDEQARILPNGTIGFAFPNTAEILPAVPKELVDALAKTLSGEILPTQLSEMVTAHLLRQIKKSNNTMVL